MEMEFPNANIYLSGKLNQSVRTPTPGTKVSGITRLHCIHIYIRIWKILWQVNTHTVSGTKFDALPSKIEVKPLFGFSKYSEDSE